MTDPKMQLNDEALSDVVGGQIASNGKKKLPGCPTCANTMVFYCNVDTATMKVYCPCTAHPKVYLFNTVTGTVTDTGETM